MSHREQFFKELDRRVAETSAARLMLKNRPANLHDYQGCENDTKDNQIATLTQERDALRLHVERLDAALEECWFNDDTTLSLPEWKVELLKQADFKIFSARAAAASPEEKPAICPKCNRPHYNMEDSAACREAAPEPSKEPTE